MRLSVMENKVLNAIAACYPTKSSYKKLTTELGVARNELLEVIDDLKKVKYVNDTPSNEIYLMKEGLKCMGIEAIPTTKSAQVKEGKSVDEFYTPSTKEEVTKVALGISVKVTDQLNSDTREKRIDDQLNALLEKISKPKSVIGDLELKGQVLTRLADIVSDDIAEVLLSVNEDLKQA